MRRVFAAYAAGQGPRAIATSLNAECVPAPGGGPWFDSTIRGGAGRSDGLLRNRLYIGQAVWNRARTVKNPATGRARKRRNASSAHVCADVPELRLISDEVWEAGQARLAASAAAPRETGQGAAFW